MALTMFACSAPPGTARRTLEATSISWVDMSAGRNLLNLIALSNELGDKLGIQVDVVTEAGLSPYLRERILAEGVAL